MCVRVCFVHNRMRTEMHASIILIAFQVLKLDGFCGHTVMVDAYCISMHPMATAANNQETS